MFSNWINQSGVQTTVYKLDSIISTAIILNPPYTLNLSTKHNAV